MYSSLIFPQIFCSSPKFTKHYPNSNYNYIVSNSISSPKHTQPSNIHHLSASSGFTSSIEEFDEDEDKDEDEDSSKFVPLNTENPAFGPPALLLLGFQTDEVLDLEQLLKEMDAEFLDIVLCSEEMMKDSLWNAVDKKQKTKSKVKKNGCLMKIGGNLIPRICVMSGLTGEEMIMLIDAFNEGGFEGTVFAAMVANSADKTLDEVVEEIMADHRTVMSTK